MKATKRFLSVIMASAMLCGSVGAVSAAEVTDLGSASGGVTGTGAVEGYTSKEVLRVVLPTNKLDFIVDPQGLIKASDKSKYAKNTTYRWDFKDYKNVELNNGFVFFAQPGTEKDEATGKVTNITTYTSHLDLTVENKSSFKVDITPKCTYTDGTITTAGVDESGTPKTDTKNVGLAEKTFVNFAIYKGTTVAAKETLSDLNSLYKVVYDAKAGYKYQLDETAYAAVSDPSTLKNKSTITLVGSSIETATGWDAVLANMATVAKPPKGTTVTKPTVEVTWTIAKSATK